jgi:hypothetical protein
MVMYKKEKWHIEGLKTPVWVKVSDYIDKSRKYPDYECTCTNMFVSLR